jgi:hypothetical protein
MCHDEDGYLSTSIAMVRTVDADQLTFYDLEKSSSFNGCMIHAFFPAWPAAGGDVEAIDLARLERVKRHYIHLTTRPMLPLGKHMSNRNLERLEPTPSVRNGAIA